MAIKPATIEQTECTTTISKSGRNILARIPDEFTGQITRGCVVKVTLLERPVVDPEKVKGELKKLVSNIANKTVFKSHILGRPIEIKLNRLAAELGEKKLIELLRESLKEVR